MKRVIYSLFMAATLLVALSCNETPAEVEQNATVAVSATLENGRE